MAIETKIFVDMTGRSVAVSYPPRRIVSLVPSQTELLYDLGLDAEVVGITKFCVHPHDWFRNKKRVGGTKTVHLHMVRELAPDLIIANKEENTKEQIEKLAAQFPVWISDIKTVADGLQMITDVGHIVGKTDSAATMAAEIADSFLTVALQGRPMKVAYYIWKDPWMSVGGDTFIGDVIRKMGWQNVLDHLSRYPVFEPSQFVGTELDMILLSSEPYPFKDKHIAEIHQLLPGVLVILVDGEMFSWYGSRMLKAIPYLRGLAQFRSAI